MVEDILAARHGRPAAAAAAAAAPSPPAPTPPSVPPMRPAHNGMLAWKGRQFPCEIFCSSFGNDLLSALHRQYGTNQLHQTLLGIYCRHAFMRMKTAAAAGPTQQQPDEAVHENFVAFARARACFTAIMNKRTTFARIDLATGVIHRPANDSVQYGNFVAIFSRVYCRLESISVLAAPIVVSSYDNKPADGASKYYEIFTLHALVPWFLLDKSEFFLADKLALQMHSDLNSDPPTGIVTEWRIARSLPPLFMLDSVPHPSSRHTDALAENAKIPSEWRRALNSVPESGKGAWYFSGGATPLPPMLEFGSGMLDLDVMWRNYWVTSLLFSMARFASESFALSSALTQLLRSGGSGGAAEEKLALLNNIDLYIEQSLTSSTSATKANDSFVALVHSPSFTRIVAMVCVALTEEKAENHERVAWLLRTVEKALTQTMVSMNFNEVEEMFHELLFMREALLKENLTVHCYEEKTGAYSPPLATDELNAAMIVAGDYYRSKYDLAAMPRYLYHSKKHPVTSNLFNASFLSLMSSRSLVIVSCRPVFFFGHFTIPHTDGKVCNPLVARQKLRYYSVANTDNISSPIYVKAVMKNIEMFRKQFTAELNSGGHPPFAASVRSLRAFLYNEQKPWHEMIPDGSGLLGMHAARNLFTGAPIGGKRSEEFARFRSINPEAGFLEFLGMCKPFVKPTALTAMVVPDRSTEPKNLVYYTFAEISVMSEADKRSLHFVWDGTKRAYLCYDTSAHAVARRPIFSIQGDDNNETKLTKLRAAGAMPPCLDAFLHLAQFDKKGLQHYDRIDMGTQLLSIDDRETLGTAPRGTKRTAAGGEASACKRTANHAYGSCALRTTLDVLVRYREGSGCRCTVDASTSGGGGIIYYPFIDEERAFVSSLGTHNGLRLYSEDINEMGSKRFLLIRDTCRVGGGLCVAVPQDFFTHGTKNSTQELYENFPEDCATSGGRPLHIPFDIEVYDRALATIARDRTVIETRLLGAFDCFLRTINREPDYPMPPMFGLQLNFPNLQILRAISCTANVSGGGDKFSSHLVVRLSAAGSPAAWRGICDIGELVRLFHRFIYFHPLYKTGGEQTLFTAPRPKDSEDRARISTSLNDEMVPVFDLKIYTKNRAFRMFGSTKKGQNRPLGHMIEYMWNESEKKYANIEPNAPPRNDEMCIKQCLVAASCCDSLVVLGFGKDSTPPSSSNTYQHLLPVITTDGLALEPIVAAASSSSSSSGPSAPPPPPVMSDFNGGSSSGSSSILDIEDVGKHLKLIQLSSSVPEIREKAEERTRDILNVEEHYRTQFSKDVTFVAKSMSVTRDEAKITASGCSSCAVLISGEKKNSRFACPLAQYARKKIDAAQLRQTLQRTETFAHSAAFGEKFFADLDKVNPSMPGMTRRITSVCASLLSLDVVVNRPRDFVHAALALEKKRKEK